MASAANHSIRYNGNKVTSGQSWVTSLVLMIPGTKRFFLLLAVVGVTKRELDSISSEKEASTMKNDS